MSKKDVRTIPSTVLNQISEHSPAGFVLFSISPEGKTEIYSIYDSDVSAMALHKFVHLWSNAVEQLHEDAIYDIILPPEEHNSQENE